MSHCYTDPPTPLKAEKMSVHIYHKTLFFLINYSVQWPCVSVITCLCLCTLSVDDGRETQDHQPV